METTNTPPRVLTRMPRRIPVNGTFELTVRCNLHCKMCMFRHDDRENPELMAKELTAAQWIDMARQAAEAGTMNLLITGGEPLLRPDFCEIWEGIYRQGFVTTLYTNATLVTPRVMETLRKYPPHKIGVTIYGASPETYGRVCGHPEAFQKMVEGIHQLQTLPSQMEYRATIIKDNFEDGPAIDELVRREFEIDNAVKQSCPVNKAVRGGCADVESCRVAPELDMQAKMERIVESFHRIVGDRFKRENLKITRTNHAAATGEQKARATLFGCDAGMSQYTITYEGYLLACQMIGAFSTNAKINGLKNAWERFPFEVHVPYDEGKCGDCKYQDGCRACYGTRYAETGDFNGCSDYLLRVAKANQQYEDITGGKDHDKCSI